MRMGMTCRDTNTIPEGYWWGWDGQNWMKCVPGCKICDNQYECIECRDDANMVITNPWYTPPRGTCVRSCGDGKVSVSRICYDCDMSCRTCSV